MCLSKVDQKKCDIIFKMTDCYDEILACDREVNKYKILIELMKDLDKEISNTLRVRNCLLFLINTCFSQKHPDYAYHKGKTKQKLSKEEKYQMYNLLKEEFYN